MDGGWEHPKPAKRDFFLQAMSTLNQLVSCNILTSWYYNDILNRYFDVRVDC